MPRKRVLLFIAIAVVVAAIAVGLVVFATAQNIDGALVVVTVKPQRVLIETTEMGQHVNFDFLLENRSNKPLKLTTVELSVFDRQGALARRDFVNVFSRKSVAMDGDKVIPPRGSMLFYNPMPDFAASVPLHRLQYEFSFTSKAHLGHASARAEVFPVTYRTKTNLIVPLRGRVLNWDGHDLASHHRRTDFTQMRMEANFQRYGYDFVLVDERGSMYRGPKKKFDDWYRTTDDNADYYGFGADILAAGDGVVADVHDGDADNRRFDESELAKRETAYGGNYIIIDHGNGEFSWFGHLQQGSVRVKKGQRVKQGEVIARMGASGSSLFPHLHYELRSATGARRAEGLPSEFTRFQRLLGTTVVNVERGTITTGEIVQSRF